MEKQSEEGKQKELDREASQNEQIRETGQAVLDGNSRKHKVELLTVIGKSKVMNPRRLTAKQPSMSVYCQSWLSLRTMRRSRDF